MVTKRKNVRKMIFIGFVACAIPGIAIHANAQSDPVVTMQLENYTTYADVINLGTMQIPGDPTVSGYIGIYSFNVSASTTPSVPTGTFWSLCLSPAGVIDGGSPPANYYYESYAQASPGINPSVWAWNNSLTDPQYWGIQNANYLWEKIMKGDGQPTMTANQATALVLAMYDALYNSTGYGTLGGHAFNPEFGTSSISGNVAAVESAFNADLGLLNPTLVGNNLANGYVLVPTSQTQHGWSYGQDFLFTTSSSPNVVVPESAGMGVVAGLGALLSALLLSVRRSQV
jgi:hypothetical protein